MKINSNTIGIFVVILTSLSLITALASIIYLSSVQVFAMTIEDQQKFSAQLSGDQEVPPLQTNPSGMA
ncbi:MAG TPA: CHRD domain-containing protein [Nitrososphaeraceae archaeon]|jgi:hypothetical protein|nr:CHRD domain-containing protein [Nitrososphaeraceae archaeon]